MAEKYGPIYEAIQKRNIDGFNKVHAIIQNAQGNANFIEEMFDEHAVVVDKTNNRSHNGLNQIKLMIEGFLQTGKIEFKMPRRVFHDLGGDRFLVDVDYETTIVATGAVIKGSFQQLFHKNDDKWKCVYECNEMH